MLVFLFCIIAISLQQENCVPWGIRLSLGQYYMNQTDNTFVYVAFNTNSSCVNSFITASNNNISCLSQNVTTPSINYTTFVHWCAIKDVKFGSNAYISYSYQVFGMYNNGTYQISENITFNLVNKHIQDSYEALILGDWGIVDDNHSQYYNIMPILDNYLKANRYAFAIFLGDIAYDFCDQKAQNCNNYYPMLKAIEFVTKSVPFMATFGNHQYGRNRPNVQYLYALTFIAPYRQLQSYSFEVGKIQYQNFNPYQQVYNYTTNTTQKVTALKNLYNNKGPQIQWVIPFSHYPFYCAGYVNNSDCVNKTYQQTMAQFIEYFNDYKIDLVLGAHIHLFYRTKPINKYAVVGYYEDKSGSGNIVYENPSSPVYIYEGSAGNNYYVQLQKSPLYVYEASTFVNTGFSVLASMPKEAKLQNKHIYGSNGTVAETFVIHKVNRAWQAYAVVGSMIVILIIVLIITYILKRRNSKKKQQDNEQVNLSFRTTSEPAV